MYNEELELARRAYVNSALAELNAVCNVIDNDSDAKTKLLMERARQAGEIAQQQYWLFIEVAKRIRPENSALESFSLGSVSDNED